MILNRVELERTVRGDNDQENDSENHISEYWGRKGEGRESNRTGAFDIELLWERDQRDLEYEESDRAYSLKIDRAFPEEEGEEGEEELEECRDRNNGR